MIFFWLLALNMVFLKFIHVTSCIRMQNAVPSYTTVCFFSFICWILCCFSLPTVMNNATLTFMHKFLCGPIFPLILGINLSVKLLDHLLILCLIFWSTSRLFSKLLCYFTFPAATYEIPIFPPILVSDFLFYFIHLSGCAMATHCGFALYFYKDW